MVKIECRDCGATYTGQDVEDLENVVGEDDGYLSMNYTTGDILEFECPTCGGEDADFSKEG